MQWADSKTAAQAFDVVVIGSGFGSLFFLASFLKRHPDKKVLILEWGRNLSRQWQVENQQNSDIDPNDTFRNAGKKDWNFNIGLGGGTNCWQGMSIRMHPNDFELHRRYGVGLDWPLGYDDLVGFYEDAERIMNVAGPADLGRHFPGAGGYAQRAHRQSSAERILKANRPDTFFAAPSAKLTRPVEGRGACCANGTCSLCPTGAKFYAIEGMRDVWDHPSVFISTEARVRHIVHEGATARSVIFEKDGREHEARGDLIVLGANAIHSPFILLQSGIDDGKAGHFIGEKMMGFAEIFLDGVEHFDGGSATTGCEVSLIDGEHRSRFGGSLFWIENSFLWAGLRLDPPGRTREVLPVGIVVEDLLYENNAVIDSGGEFPVVQHEGFSDYARRGLDHALSKAPEIFASLPIESIELRWIKPTTDHIQGSLRMGTNPETSVVDASQIHHRIRNLVVVGTSVFPTTSWAVPSLTCAALSLRAGARI